eukprot:m.127869 g.127869  ORF g.127869 m.127869 type:complete len:331 (-) comp11219_c1_seq2:1443-2435(-)
MSTNTASPRLAIIVHGGAWDIPDALEKASRRGCVDAASVGYSVLAQGGTAVEAVEAAVRIMEDNPVFDCGHGSVLNADGEVEMDAMIMDGNGLHAGAVAAVQGVSHPITLARQVMRQSDHVFLVGKGARRFADEMGHAVTPASELVTPAAQAEYDAYKRTSYRRPVHDLFNKPEGHDTVGAVAVDCMGNVAAATSTGGITMKRPGRVGDSPLIGAGGYADNSMGACSATGHGESLARYTASYRALAHLAASGNDADPSDAVHVVLQTMLQRVEGRGGLIVVTPDGRVGHGCTTRRMVWASCRGVYAHGSNGTPPSEVANGFENEQRVAKL